MIGLLYCFDENYNVQSCVSIFSILENLNFKVDIHIIHKTESFKNFLPLKIQNHKNVNEIYVYKFNKSDIKFYNLEDVHVSEATYYRLFLNNYIKTDAEYLFYVDGDIVCVNNFSDQLLDAIEKLKQSNYIISAYTEYDEDKGQELEMKGLELSSNKYFNAGVMIIDYRQWRKSNVSYKLIKVLDEIKYKIKFWDQDVMNKYFDGEYVELEESFNTRIWNIKEYDYNTINKIYQKKVFLIHYAGKFKPWQVKGSVQKASIFFQNNYSFLYNKYSFIQFTKRSNAIKQLLSCTFLKNQIRSDLNSMHLLIILREVIFKRNIKN